MPPEPTTRIPTWAKRLLPLLVGLLMGAGGKDYVIPAAVHVIPQKDLLADISVLKTKVATILAQLESVQRDVTWLRDRAGAALDKQ